MEVQYEDYIKENFNFSNLFMLLVITEWILALGTKDPWDKMWKWAEK